MATETIEHFPLVPAPPDWAVDWESIAARFGWIRAMDGVPQDAQHHAEGNVLMHTRMVVEAMVGDDRWRQATDEDRAALFAAALLHDVAKPACTRIAADGTIGSPGHARRGELMAREILYIADGLD